MPIVTYEQFNKAVDLLWTIDQAVALARLIEPLCPQHGCHVALTGGCLYKGGARKDCDFLFYRIRQEPEIDKEGLFRALSIAGIEVVSGFGWVHKAKYKGKTLDLFFPESDDESGYPGTTGLDITL